MEMSASPVDPYAIRVQSRVQSGWRAMVPSLWQLEVANGLLMIERRKTLTTAVVNRGLLDLDAFLASKAEVDQTLVPMQHLVDLARTHQLTVYDVTYFELSQRESLPLATLDKNLRAAAVKAGVELLK